MMSQDVIVSQVQDHSADAQQFDITQFLALQKPVQLTTQVTPITDPIVSEPKETIPNVTTVPSAFLQHAMMQTMSDQPATMWNAILAQVQLYQLQQQQLQLFQLQQQRQQQLQQPQPQLTPSPPCSSSSSSVSPVSKSSSQSNRKRKQSKQDKEGSEGPEGPAEKAYKPRSSRLKIYFNGYFLSFDKSSADNKKNFWRCERKNSCNFRMHSDGEKHIHLLSLHEHNHEGISERDCLIYGIVKEERLHNKIYPVDTLGSHLFDRRNLEELMDDEKFKGLGLMKMAELQAAPRIVARAPRVPIPRSPSTKVAIEQILAMAQTPDTLKDIMNKRETVEEQESGDTQPTQEMRMLNEAIEQNTNFLDYYKLVKAIKSIPLMQKKHDIVANNNTNVAKPAKYIYVCFDKSIVPHIFRPINICDMTVDDLRQRLEQMDGTGPCERLCLHILNKTKIVIHTALISSWDGDKVFHIEKDKAVWKLVEVLETDD